MVHGVDAVDENLSSLLCRGRPNAFSYLAPKNWVGPSYQHIIPLPLKREPQSAVARRPARRRVAWGCNTHALRLKNVN